MKYVLDSSVALKWVLPEPLSQKARQLRDDYQKQIHELLALDVFPAEVAHALTRAERKKTIPVGHAACFLAGIFAVMLASARKGSPKGNMKQALDFPQCFHSPLGRFDPRWKLAALVPATAAAALLATLAPAL